LNIPSAECVRRIFPLLMVDLALAVPVFWWLSTRADARLIEEKQPDEEPPGSSRRPDGGDEPRRSSEEEPKDFRVNWLKAAVPLLPITLLFLSGPPLSLLSVPRAWLEVPGQDAPNTFESRLIGAAMLVGVAAAALTSGATALRTASVFFEGAGQAFASIIGIIVSASCFGEGVKQLGLAKALGTLIDTWPALLLPTAGSVPLAFAWLSGSGMAATQSLFAFFVKPAGDLGIDAAHVGAVVSIAAAAGRTMSPVAAVTLMSAAMTETRPLDLVRRVALPLLVGVAGVVVAGSLGAM
jgi:DcuC family C4-dicarboxylate transporter